MEPQCSLVSITRSFRSKLLGTLLIYSLVVVVVPFRITLELPLSVEQDAESLRVEFGPYNDDLTRHADKIVRDHYHKLLFGSSSYYAQLCGDPPHYVNMRCVISDIESRMDIPFPLNYPPTAIAHCSSPLQNHFLQPIDSIAAVAFTTRVRRSETFLSWLQRQDM